MQDTPSGMDCQGAYGRRHCFLRFVQRIKKVIFVHNCLLCCVQWIVPPHCARPANSLNRFFVIRLIVPQVICQKSTRIRNILEIFLCGQGLIAMTMSDGDSGHCHCPLRRHLSLHMRSQEVRHNVNHRVVVKAQTAVVRMVYLVERHIFAHLLHVVIQHTTLRKRH